MRCSTADFPPLPKNVRRISETSDGLGHATGNGAGDAGDAAPNAAGDAGHAATRVGCTPAFQNFFGFFMTD